MAAIQGDWYASAGGAAGYQADPDTVRFVYATQPNGEKYIVAKVWSGDDGDYEGTARLVAAAQELLKVARMAIDYANDTKDKFGVNFDGDDAESYDNLIDAADAAIAKAEGRTE